MGEAVPRGRNPGCEIAHKSSMLTRSLDVCSTCRELIDEHSFRQRAAVAAANAFENADKACTATFRVLRIIASESEIDRSLSEAELMRHYFSHAGHISQ